VLLILFFVGAYLWYVTPEPRDLDK
jgi:hypothetical protein